MGRLLVSVRGPDEALAAANGIAHIAGVEYSALHSLRKPVSCNISRAVPLRSLS